MKLLNYVLARWADGYNYVSDADTTLASALEQTLKVISSVGDHATLDVRRVRVDDKTVPLALVRFDVIVPPSPRRLQYSHVVVLPAEYRDLPIDAWRRVLERKYGADVEAHIREVYERIAVTSKSAGRSLVEPFEIELGDLEAEAAPEATVSDPAIDGAAIDGVARVIVAAPGGDKPLPPTSVRDLPPTGGAASRLAPTLIGAAGIVLALLTYRCGRVSGAEQATAALGETQGKLTACASDLNDAHKLLAAAEHKLGSVPGDLTACAVEKESLRNEVASCGEARSLVEGENSRLKGSFEGLTKERGELIRTKADLQAKIDDLEQDKLALAARIDTKDHKIDELRRWVRWTCSKMPRPPVTPCRTVP